jgi:hypothetical protein
MDEADDFRTWGQGLYEQMRPAIEEAVRSGQRVDELITQLDWVARTFAQLRDDLRSGSIPTKAPDAGSPESVSPPRDPDEG